MDQKVTDPETLKSQTFVREKDLKDHLEPKAKDGKDMSKEEKKEEDSPSNKLMQDDFQLKYSLDLLKSWQVFHLTKKAA